MLLWRASHPDEYEKHLSDLVSHLNKPKEEDAMKLGNRRVLGKESGNKRWKEQHGSRSELNTS